MDYKKFFLENNKSGYKSKESYLKNNFLDLYNNILNFNSGQLSKISFKEKIWHFINNEPTIPKCKNCQKDLKFKRSLNEGYGDYCSVLCTNTSLTHINNVKKTNNIKYGGNSPISSKDIKNKIKQTNTNKYGVVNPFQNTQHIKNKTKQKYGVDHISKLDSTKEKIKKTNIDKFGVSTPLLLDDTRDKGYEKTLELFNEKYKNLKIINNKGRYVTILCDVCNQNYTIDRSLLFYRHDNIINPCTNCNGVKELTSIKENELFEFIASLNVKPVRNDRLILNGKELDIYIPTHNIGIEFNGLYYHSDKFKSNDYHLDKTNVCESKNIKLIQVFEDEWDFKKDIVKSRIKNLLGLNETKIYARKCNVGLVSTSEKTKFLNENHIQGPVGSKINIGLYYNNELVSIMTFGPGRKVTKGTDYDYELIRFSNKINTSIVGGASRLLTYFIKNYKPKNIISYADRRWSQGGLYELLGFDKIRISNPNYFYILNKKREYRFKFRKNILVGYGFNKEMSEKEIMKSRGINRIYDCGNIIYVKSAN